MEDPDWTASNGTAVYNQLMNIAAGQTSSVMITFRVDTGISGQLINETEISDAKDEFGADVEDIDSTPDSDVANDTGGEVNTPDDNNVAENGRQGEDEDDADPEDSLLRFSILLYANN